MFIPSSSVDINPPLNFKLTQPYPRIYKPPVQFRDFEVNRSCIKLNRLLGAGNFGEVHEGLYNNQLKVAIKISKPQANMHAFMNEARTMHALHHERIVQMLGVCTEPPEEPIYIILELVPNGSLHSHLVEHGSQLTVVDKILILSQVMISLTIYSDIT